MQYHTHQNFNKILCSVRGVLVHDRLLNKDRPVDVRVIMVRFSAWNKFISSPKSQGRLWGPPGLVFNGHRGLFPQAWSWLLIPSKARIKTEWSYTSTPPYTFMALTEQLYHRNECAGRGSRQDAQIRIWAILIIKPKRCTNFSNLFLE